MAGMAERRRNDSGGPVGMLRDHYGAIVTFQHVRTGAQYVCVEEGGKGVAVASACVRFLRRGLDPAAWRVQTVSTPTTVWRDLRPRKRVASGDQNPYEGRLVSEIVAAE